MLYAIENKIEVALSKQPHCKETTNIILKLEGIEDASLKKRLHLDLYFSKTLKNKSL